MGIFADNTTALSYVRKQGGTLPPALNAEARFLLRWMEEWEITLVPQFIMGSQNVIADSLSHQHQVMEPEWTLAQDIVNSLLTLWPATVDLFTTSIKLSPAGILRTTRRSDVGRHRRLSADVGRATGIRLSSFHPDTSGVEQAARLQGDLYHLDHPILAAERVVLRSPESGCGSSGAPSTSEASSQTATFPSSAPEPPRASPSYVRLFNASPAL